MKDKLINRLHNYWKNDNKIDNKKLLKNLTNIIYYQGTNGAEHLLDWCRTSYEDYYKKNNITQEIISKNYGDIDCGELDIIWNICNWYLDYCNNQISEKDLLELMII